MPVTPESLRGMIERTYPNNGRPALRKFKKKKISRRSTRKR